MNEIEQRVNNLFEQIPESRHKQEIIQEITQNLLEKVSDLVAQGLTEDQAIQMALEDFGDIGELKKELESEVRIERTKKSGLSLAFSIWGTVLTSALFLFINFYYTPQIIWFVYPIFAILWWPVTQFFQWRRIKYSTSFGLPFSISSYILIMAILIFTNYYFTPHTIWFIYPAFSLIWWPLVIVFHRIPRKNRKDEETDE